MKRNRYIVFSLIVTHFIGSSPQHSHYSVGYLHLLERILHHDELLKDAHYDIEPDLTNQTPIFISLGNSCVTATALSEHKLRCAAFPFDWIWTPLKGLCLLLTEDFKDFLNPDYLLYRGQEAIINRKYNISFLHDFPFQAEKYERRIKRFYRVMQEARCVYLLRTRYVPIEPVAYSQHDIEILRDILLQKFPRNNWTLIILDMGLEFTPSPDIPRVKIFHLHNSNHPAGGGDHNAWGQTFKDILSIGIE